MNESMYKELNEILESSKGDIIEFRVYKGGNFIHLISLAEKHSRNVYGMDTFYGLENPCKQFDRNKDNYVCYPKGYAKTTKSITDTNIKNNNKNNYPYNLYEGKLEDTILNIPKDAKFSIAIVDMLQYEPTKTVLNYIKDKMVEGGMIYFLHYTPYDSSLSTLAVNEFLSEFSENIDIKEDIIYNGNLPQYKRVVWKTPKEKTDNTIEYIKRPKRKRKKKDDEYDITAALVLKSGGDTYNQRYVNALAANIKNNSKKNIKISVLTDLTTDFDFSVVDEIIPLKHDFKGWWSKIELFRPNIFTTNKVIFFDLDTVIVNNIDDIMDMDTNFAGIRDLYHWDILQTGVMIWNPNDNHQIYHRFITDSSNNIKKFFQGDANWIRANVNEYDYIQDYYPNKLISFKANCLNKVTGKITIPESASIVCFHGKPRPHTIKDSAITKHWKY